MDNLLLHNAHTFSKSYNTLEQTSLITPKCNLTHNYPIQTKPYKMPYNAREFAEQEIKNCSKLKLSKSLIPVKLFQ